MNLSPQTKNAVFAAVAMASLIAVAVAVLPKTTEPISDPLADQPNIIVVMTDDQSLSSMAKMPFMRQRNGWYKFENYYIHNSTCCPSRATFLTGQYSHHHGVQATGGAPAFDDSSTLATWLDNAGYRTGFVGKYHLGARDPVAPTYIPPGWDWWIEHEINMPEQFGGGNSKPYYDYALNVNGMHEHHGSLPEDYATDVLANHALEFLQQNTADPFFLWFAPRAPHNDWTPAPRHVGAYANEPVINDPSWGEADMSDKPEWWQARPLPGNTTGARRKEWTALLPVDEFMNQLMVWLQQSGVRKETIVIFTSDNGYAYGEHRWGGKVCAYDPCNRVPLIIKYGDHSEGWQWEDLISNEDLAPTLADLAGAETQAPVNGQSAANFLRANAAPEGWENRVLLRGYNAIYDQPGTGNNPTFWAIRTPEYKYIRTPDTGERELYDLALDPYELNSVAVPVPDPNGPPVGEFQEGRYFDAEIDLDAQLDAMIAQEPQLITEESTP